VTPHIVKFTDFDFDTNILYRRVHQPIPATWARHQFQLESYDDPERALAEWLTNNLYGRWVLNCKMTVNGYTVVIGFEEDKDAVMFRLMEGDTAWQQGIVIVF
jgi:hypothetical protein